MYKLNTGPRLRLLKLVNINWRQIDKVFLTVVTSGTAVVASTKATAGSKNLRSSFSQHAAPQNCKLHCAVGSDYKMRILTRTVEGLENIWPTRSLAPDIYDQPELKSATEFISVRGQISPFRRCLCTDMYGLAIEVHLLEQHRTIAAITSAS